MALAPWTTAIVSTAYDLADIRAALAKDLSDAGFEVLAFERPGYPVPPSVHSHEACVLALDQADIAVVVVDRRYGGLYLGTGDISITETEYRTAMARGKVVIPCVRREAWDERHQMFETEKQLRRQMKGIDPRKLLKPKYVQNWEVLDFIERLRKADTNNFVVIFDNVVGLKEALRGRLEGLSHWLLKRLVTDQIHLVRDIKTTTGMAFSLGDVLDKGHFVDPPYRVKSGPSKAGTAVSTLVQSVLRQRACVALLGEPGSGKSTLVGRAFLSHANRSLKSSSVDLPFFVSLRGRGQSLPQFPEYVNESMAILQQRKPYPLMKLDRIKPTFYMDGLDEMAEERAGFNFARFCESDMLKSPFMLSCRSRFASEFLDDPIIGNRFSSIIELEPWGPSVTSKYIKEFCRIRQCKPLMQELTRTFSEGGEMNEIGTNPLLLTLFLYLVSEAGLRVPLDIRNKHTLLAEALEKWARREIARLRGSKVVNQDEIVLLLHAWAVGAWHVYCARFTAKPPIKLEHLLNGIKGVLPEAQEICDSEAFAGILDVQPHTDEVTGFTHEQLLEELVAELLCDAMRNRHYPFPESLSVAVRWEINQLIRSIWAGATPDVLRDTLANLVSDFETTLTDNSPKSVLRRNQAAYYMGRIDTPDAIRELRHADAREGNLFVKLSIGFGLMKRLQFDVEQEFVKRLQDDPDWDAANRGYHLFYYQDWHVVDLLPPYEDPGTTKWDNTLRALLRHIESPSVRHVAIRRVELLTIRRLMETRQARGPLMQEIMQRIEVAVNATAQAAYREVPGDFPNHVLAEFARLKGAWSLVH